MYDYIWKKHGVQSSISSCDPQQHSEISMTALGLGDTTSHVAVYTVHPRGFRELYRHFLRLPSGAIVEVSIHEKILMQMLCMSSCLHACGCIYTQF